MNPRSVIVAFVVGLSLTANFAAQAWDGTGHMLVAKVAYDRLNDKARARVEELAAKLDNNGTQYNAVSVACWPDDIKDRNSKSQFQGKFKQWHYIDIGCLPKDPDVFAKLGALSQTNGDIITALDHCVDLIRNKKTDDLVPKEEVALALLMHLVGDIHQPLHTTARYNPDPKPDDKYKDDAGGNGVTLANLGDTPWGKNLHTFWDEAYRRYFQNGEVKADAGLAEADVMTNPAVKDWLAKLDAEAPKDEKLAFEGAKTWAMETHQIACFQVYGSLHEEYGAKNVTLTEDYVGKATKLARKQLVLAGYRLGALLNDLYGK